MHTTMTPAAQWVAIVVSMAVMLGAFTASHARQVPTWAARLTVGLVVAAGLAVFASTASALTYIDCTVMMTSYWWIFWGC